MTLIVGKEWFAASRLDEKSAYNGQKANAIVDDRSLHEFAYSNGVPYKADLEPVRSSIRWDNTVRAAEEL